MSLLQFSTRPSAVVHTLVSEGKWQEVANMVRKGLSPSVMATESFSIQEEFFRQAAKGALPEDLDQDEVFEVLVSVSAPHNSSRLTPLAIACVVGREHWVDFLLRKGHSPTEQGDGHNPLTALASLGIPASLRTDRLASAPEYGWENRDLALAQQRCLDLVLDSGADINQHSSRGATPLVLSCLAKNTCLATFFLSRGADPNHSHTAQQKLFSLKPLEIAIVSHNETLVCALLDAGANMFSRPAVDLEGVGTLVDVAAGIGQQGMMQALEERLGKDHPCLEEAWWVALRGGNRDTIDWYIRGRIDPYKAVKNGLSTSHVLARAGHDDLLSDFFRRGLSLDLPDQEGNTAWDVLSVYHPDLYRKARLEWRGIPGNVVAAAFPQVAERQT